MIYDTHAHLDHLPDLDLALEEAHKAGVLGIVAVSMDFPSCQKNLEIKRKTSRPKVYLAMGMHPSEADLEEIPLCTQLIEENVHELTAIGEIGLDFWYKWVKKDSQKKEEQIQVFHHFLTLAKKLNLPVIVHSRGAWKECLDMVKEAGLAKALFHWYSGPVDILEQIMSAGFYVSTSPSLAYSPQSREAISQALIERLLIETDCPVHYREENSEETFQAAPKDVFRTLKAYCQLKNMEEKNALEIFNRNAKSFFGIV